jgi:acyl carrier protein
MATREEIFEKVQSTLVDALGVDEDEVKGDATLAGDLGAESIDFLDIVFRLEKNFNIKIPRGDLFPENLLNDPQYVDDGKLTAAGAEEFRSRMPWAADHIREGLDVRDLFTVDMIVGYIEHKLNELATSQR